jgi:hypothetical protein
MSTENDPYLTVPDYAKLNQNFGKEKLYSGYTAPSAVSDLAAAAAASNLQTGARTPDKGKYIYDSKTGQYIWVPATAAAAATSAGISVSPYYQNQNQERLMPGKGDGESSNPGWDAMTGLERAAYFEANPNMAKLDSFLTGALNNSLLGKALSLNPFSKNLADERAAQQKGTNAYLTFMGSDIANPKSFNPALHSESEGPMDTDTSNAMQNAANAMSQNAQNAVNTNSSVTDPSQRAQAMVAARESAPLGPAATGPTGQSIGDMAEAEGVALGPAATGDVKGGGGGGGPGGCFLTTAAVSHMKQKDNGEVLNTLRDFRDTYMRKNKEKSKDVAWYYKNAPRIVAALDKRDDADKVYKKMYSDFIKPAYKAIQEGDDAHAYEIYKDGINFAKKHSGIDKEDLTPRYGPRGMASGGISNFAGGGLGDLGGYSDGGRLLRGPGDGVSDSIPASIGGKRPARLADGEFVVPARIVSELGNGSTDAGARKLYAMLDRIQAGRKKTVGKGKVATNSRADKNLPA